MGKQLKPLRKMDGELQERAKSRHITMKKEGMVTTLSIPEHKVLDRGLLKSLIRDAYIPLESSNELLKK